MKKSRLLKMRCVLSRGFLVSALFAVVCTAWFATDVAATSFPGRQTVELAPWSPKQAKARLQRRQVRSSSLPPRPTTGIARSTCNGQVKLDTQLSNLS